MSKEFGRSRVESGKCHRKDSAARLVREPIFGGFLENHGLDSSIEESEANLSGGGKQKLALDIKIQQKRY